MPAKKSKASEIGLIAKLGDRLRKAHDDHKNDETEYSNFSNLPPGINNGIAELEDCEFQVVKEGKENAGEYQFYAAGIVLEPIEHDYEDPSGSGRIKTMKVQGLRTFIVEPLYDTDTRTRKTLDDHLAYIYNELRKLGYDTSQMEFEELESAAAALREAKPRFKFRTWRGTKQSVGQYANKEPMTAHFWDGLVDDDYIAPDNPSQDVDNTLPNRESNPTKGRDFSKNGEEPTMFSEIDDIDSLVRLAKGADGLKRVEDARQRLIDLAVTAGRTEQEANDVSSWEEVAEMIRQASMGTEEEDVKSSDTTPSLTTTTSEPAPSLDEAVLSAPEKGEVWKTRLPDTKGKKSPKLIQVEVIAVSKKTQTVDVKTLVDKKVYKNIPITDLVSID